MKQSAIYDEPIRGFSGVFHVATPLDFESKDPEPTVEGVVNIIISCAKAKIVKRVVYTLTAARETAVGVRRKPVERFGVHEVEKDDRMDVLFVQDISREGSMGSRKREQRRSRQHHSDRCGRSIHRALDPARPRGRSVPHNRELIASLLHH